MSETKRPHPMGHTVPVEIFELSSAEMTNSGHTAAINVKIICDLDGMGHCDCRLLGCSLRSPNPGPIAAAIKENSGRNASKPDREHCEVRITPQ